MVVLPEPFGPEQPHDLAGLDLERDVLDAHAMAVLFGQMLRDDDRRHEP